MSLLIPKIFSQEQFDKFWTTFNDNVKFQSISEDEMLKIIEKSIPFSLSRQKFCRFFKDCGHSILIVPDKRKNFFNRKKKVSFFNYKIFTHICDYEFCILIYNTFEYQNVLDFKFFSPFDFMSNELETRNVDCIFTKYTNIVHNICTYENGRMKFKNNHYFTFCKPVKQWIYFETVEKNCTVSLKNLCIKLIMLRTSCNHTLM